MRQSISKDVIKLIFKVQNENTSKWLAKRIVYNQKHIFLSVEFERDAFD